MKWKRLIDINNNDITRGALLKFKSEYPFEENVVMMFCEIPNELGKFGLIAITGSKSGVNPYFIFSDDVVDENKIRDWLIDNWYNFSLNDNIEQVFFRECLRYYEI
ncbi:hypothetical protein LU290_06240 [Moraxella nasibovis]|uniref:hypothetical protein n=1 Tax=Moraxella nasibovis TaxID=2904120 RepID=UPI00240F546A|nr:hypothetical protein [Moraxella nasibovis]WFF37869.1 hypothetical protein LU290_06240 [Moraxella nasibovis]